MSYLSYRLALVQPSPTLAMTAKASKLKEKGIDVINLSVGEPDFQTPEFIQQGAFEAIKNGMTKYTPVEGITPLKIAIQEKFKRDNGLDYNLNQLMVSTGGKQVIFNALMATLNPGDEVIIPAPYWVSYPDIVSLFGGIPKFIRCEEEHRFKMTPQQLNDAITLQTKWVILNSPSNPTGEVYTKEELIALGRVLEKHPHVMILSDDIYEYLVYDNHSFYNIVSLCPDLFERTLIVNGVSKSYAMTGWRLGYGAGPAPLIKAMTMLQSQSTSNPSSISQGAALAALKGERNFLREWKENFMMRRDYMVRRLNEMPGLFCTSPHGAFYLYVNCENLMGKKTPAGGSLKNDNDLALYFLEAAHVAVVSGAAFGLSPYFRVSYATDMKLLEISCDRIQEALAKLP